MKLFGDEDGRGSGPPRDQRINFYTTKAEKRALVRAAHENSENVVTFLRRAAAAELARHAARRAAQAHVTEGA